LCRLGTDSVGGHNATTLTTELLLCPTFLVITEELPDVFWIVSFKPSGPPTTSV